ARVAGPGGGPVAPPRAARALAAGRRREAAEARSRRAPRPARAARRRPGRWGRRWPLRRRRETRRAPASWETPVAVAAWVAPEVRLRWGLPCPRPPVLPRARHPQGTAGSRPWTRARRLLRDRPCLERRPPTPRAPPWRRRSAPAAGLRCRPLPRRPAPRAACPRRVCRRRRCLRQKSLPPRCFPWGSHRSARRAPRGRDPDPLPRPRSRCAPGTAPGKPRARRGPRAAATRSDPPADRRMSRDRPANVRASSRGPPLGFIEHAQPGVHPLEVLAGRVETRMDRPQGDPEPLGDLFTALALELEEHEDGSLMDVQGVEGALHPIQPLPRLRGGARVRLGARQIELLFELDLVAA